jgi:hypothetical protein
MIEAGTQFIGIKPEINMQERKSAVANNPTDVFTIEDIAEAVAPYAVYTALLTQTGGDDPVLLDEGLLIIGVTYYINDTQVGMDFTNVGAPNNDVGTFFVATGTTPNSWGVDIGVVVLTYNIGAPVVTVLENTIGNVWFTYSDVGVYNINSDELFIESKTSLNIGNLNTFSNGFNARIFGDISSYPSLIAIKLLDESGIVTDGGLYNTPIEIRVYN